MNATHDTASTWKTRFFTIWIPQQLSILGSSLGRFALIWWLTKSTGSATVLATASLVASLPGVLLGPIAGTYVDRHNRQRIMVVADTVVALASLALAILFWTDSLQIWHVYAVLLVRSLGSQFHWPAMQASTSLMVPEDQLSRIAGLNSATMGVMRIVSPPVGALLLALLPLHGIMLIDVITAAIAVAPLFLVTIPQPERRVATNGEHTSLIADFREGLRYVAGWPGMVGILGIALFLNFTLDPAMSLVPLLVSKTFGGGATELGWANSLTGVGVIVGGLILGAWGGFRKKIMTSLLGLVGMGIGCLAIGLAPASMFWVLLAGLLTMSIMNPLTNGPLMAILQAKVEPSMQGRVFTLVGAAAGAMAPLGLAIAGPLSDAYGIQVWFIAGGLLCIVLSTVARFVPAIVNLEDHIPSSTSVDPQTAEYSKPETAPALSATD